MFTFCQPTFEKPWSACQGLKLEVKPVPSINSSALKNLSFLDTARLDAFFDHTRDCDRFIRQEGITQRCGVGQVELPLTSSCQAAMVNICYGHEQTLKTKLAPP